MASLFTRLVDKITPWDRGGEVQRRQEEEERRRREAEARAQAQSQPTQRTTAPQQTPGSVFMPQQNTALDTLQNPEKANQQFNQRQEQERKVVDNAYQTIQKTGSNIPFSPKTVEGVNNRLNQEKAARIANQSTADKVGNTAKSAAFGLGRFGLGLGQAAGGIFDLLTPGEGTNRLSDVATRYAEGADKFVDKNDLNPAIYRGSQIGGEAAMALLTAGAGNIAKQGAMQSPRLASAFTKFDDALNVLPGNSFTRAATRELVDPANLANEAYFANKAIGETAARGEDISPGRIALEYGLALPSAGASVIARKAMSSLSASNAESAASILQPTKAPSLIEIAPGVKVAAPEPQIPVQPTVDIRGTQFPVPTVGQAIDAPSEVAPQLFDADARALNNPIQEIDPLDVPAFQRRNAEANLQEAMARYNQLQERSDALRKAVAPEGQDRVAAFELRRQGIRQDSPMAKATKAIEERKANISEESLVKTLAEQQQAKKDVDQAIKARSAQEALQEGGPVVEKPAPVAQAEARAAETPDIVPVDDAGRVVDAVETPPIRPDMPGEGAVVTAEKPVPRTPQSELPETSASGLAKTGEVGKSKGKYAKGQEYDKTSQEASRAQGREAASTSSYEKFTADVEKKGSIDVKDRDTAIELQKRYKAGSPEHRKLGDIANKVDTEAGQTLATIERTIRRTADAKQLTDRFANKVYKNIDEGASLSKADFDKVEAKNVAFTEARDSHNQALETFNTSPTQANANAFVRAQKALEEADKAAKFTEYDVATTALRKANTDAKKKFVKQLEQDAGVYTMDLADSSMLSSTRVMLNNFLNTYGVGMEERMFGKVGARIARALTGETIGGGSRAGRKLGQKIGNQMLKSDAILRSQAKGNRLTKAIKNFTTTGNTLGERNIQGATYAGVYDHYEQVLKQAGYKGDELKTRTLVQTLSDPDEVKDIYMNQALVNNALASTSTGRNRLKLETWMTESLADKMGSGVAAQNAAKAITRVTVGFPTVIARSLQGGARRATLGGYTTLFKIAPNIIKGGDKAVRAELMKNAVKEFGSGATMMTVGAALGASGKITLAYPEDKDKDKQAQWKREGKSDYSIQIGSDWYNLPSALGVFALPFMIGAQAGQNVSEGKPMTEDAFKTTAQTVINSAPVDSFSNIPNMLSDFERGNDVTKQAVQSASSLARTAIPLGGLVNQVAKMFDPTANDTTKGDALAQFVSKVQDGIPGLTNMLPAKEVDGREVRNPSAISKLFGASSTEQFGGVEKSEEIRKTIDDSVKKLNDYGAFSDNVRNLLDDEKKSLLDKAKKGDKLDESDIKDLMSSMTKGVSVDSDTQFLEKEQYDDNLAVLKVKRDILASDPTTTQASLDDYDTQIKRGEIYKKNKTPYTLVKDYKDYGLEDWRKLGDPDEEEYDPDLYQALWALDEEMTEAGVSRGKKGKAKYYAKSSGKGGRGGSGGRGTRSSSTSQLSSGLLGVTGRQENKYVAIDKPKSYIPDLGLQNKAKTDLKKSIKVEKGVKYN